MSGLFYSGGEGEIRTPGTCYSTPDFESGTFDHSDTSPFGNYELRIINYYLILIIVSLTTFYFTRSPHFVFFFLLIVVLLIWVYYKNFKLTF